MLTARTAGPWTGLGLMLWSCASLASPLKPFTTDGCSAFPDGVPGNEAKWIECCIRHDFAYWQGGTFDERAAADGELRQCVAELGESILSEVMRLGVVAGGSPYYPTWYRWGYGWPYLRGYQALSTEERGQIVGKLEVLQNLIGDLIDETRAGPESKLVN